MGSFSRKARKRCLLVVVTARAALVISLALLSLLAAACVNINNTGSANSLGLITPGVLTVASDTTNPPLEFIDPITHQVTGFDIDLITAIARRLGLKVQILTTKVDVIISDLENKRYDVVISASDITPDLQAKVNFIPYFKAGESLLVQAGNPSHIRSLADLCGQAVGVQDATREEVDLQNASDTCQQAGKPPINLTVLKNQFAIVQLLVEHRVVATYQGSAVTDYFIKLNHGRFAVGGAMLKVNSEGIAVNKGNSALFNAIQTTLNSMKADNTYHSMIMKWGLTGEEIALLSE
jgi:polar amino acid transport system substrate-binding protein